MKTSSFLFTAAFLLLLLLPGVSFSENIELGKILVERNSSKKLTQSFDFFSKEDIQNLPFFSCEEIINYSSSVNLKKRSEFGLQQDVSLRGSVFEDANISLAGIKINDPQTGHYSLEIPLTSADLEEAGVYKNAQQISFTPKKPADKGFLLKNSFGQYALWENLLSLNFALGEAKNRLSVEHKTSKGSRQDTDFDIYNFSYHSLWEKEPLDLEFLFGATKRDFGADSFYSSNYRQEEEHINQQFYLGRAQLHADAFNLNNKIYLRRHRDKYILNRSNPAFYTNFHTTYVYGLKQEFDFYNNLFAYLGIEQEKIDSTNLNKHYRLKKGILVGMKEKQFGKFLFSISGGTDYYYKWNYLENAHLAAGYFLRENLKLRFSFDRIWRAPSFTELYYSDPANRGNPNLGIQKSNNFETGLDFSPLENLTFSPVFFFRNQTNTIDWAKNNSSDKWQAQNAGTIDVYGFDFSSRIKITNCILNEISLDYTYLNLDKSSPYSFSKYVFNYDRHKVVTHFSFDYKGFKANLIGNFSRPVDRKKYVTFDVKVEKKIRDFTLALEGINIFNKSYEEMKDIDGSKRWYKLSIAYSF
jgi:iron complex outermembrane receptor protein